MEERTSGGAPGIGLGGGDDSSLLSETVVTAIRLCGKVTYCTITEVIGSNGGADEGSHTKDQLLRDRRDTLIDAEDTG